MDSKGYYLILDVAESASYQEIKRSYRRLARKYHPDRNNSSYSEDMIKKINAAFEILSDREKRQQYDKMNYENVQIEVDHEDIPNQYESEPFSSSSSSNNNNNSHVDTNYNNEYNQYTAAENVRKGGGGSHIHDNIRDNYMWDNRSPKINTGFLDIPKGRFHIIVEPSLCMAFGSCETLAPKVFVVEKHKMFNPKAKVESETGADFESILSAAQTCPTKAIKIIDRYTGEQIYP